MKLLFRKKRNAGFTLVEMLVTIFIVTLVGLVVINFQIDIFNLNKISSDSLNIQTDVRKILKTMTAELRSLSPSDNGSYAISSVSTSSITFYSNIDADNLKEQIRYFQSGSILKKGVIKSVNGVYNPASEVLSNLSTDLANSSSSPLFYYYDKNYDGTSASLTYPLNIPSIRLVKIDLQIDKDLTKTPGALNFTTQVSLRNLKDNL